MYDIHITTKKYEVHVPYEKQQYIKNVNHYNEACW